MKTDFPCPACNTLRWQPVQTFILDRSDGRRPSAISDRMLARGRALRRLVLGLLVARPFPSRVRVKRVLGFERFRRKILFQVWMPDTDRAVLTTQYCEGCGLMVYTPRPDDDDLRAKYEYLNRSDRHRSQRRTQLASDAYVRNPKIRTVYGLVRPHLPGTGGSLLDVGGAEGRYLAPFVEEGFACDLVDYYEEQLPQVRKVGDEIADLPADRLYDALLCIAVLEHVPEPLALVQEMFRRTRPGGVIYAEVPNEIFGNLTRNLGGDPTTHINFFTPGSFRTLFELGGFEILAGNEDPYAPIWLLGRRGDTAAGVAPAPTRAPDISRFLRPPRQALARKVFRRLRRRTATY